MTDETTRHLSQQPDSVQATVSNDDSRDFFLKKVLIFVSVVTATGVLLFLLWQSMEVILLVFGGLLLGLFMRSIAERLSRHTPLPIVWSVSVVLLGLTGIMVLGIWFLLPSLQNQFNEVSRQLPQTLSELRNRIGEFSFGQWILQNLPEDPQLIKNSSSNLLGRITGIFSSFLGFLVNAAIVIVTGIYFAYNPSLYYFGIIKLFPQNRQKRVREVLDTLDYNLNRWIVGRISVMTINGSLTALGLWLLGIPLAIPLGILTALLNFIPNIGPILSAVPAILIGFTISSEKAIYVALLFLIIQNLEGFVLTPLVQQKAVSLPPVLIISAQLLMGILFGFVGVLLAVPVVAVIFVTVKMLYVEDILGNQVEVKGEQEVRDKNPEPVS